MQTNARAIELVAFWREAGLQRWFSRDDAFDAECRGRFLDLHLAASRRELDGWLDAPTDALALVLLLDQIPRNVFRHSAHAWATDPLARSVADRAIEAGHDAATDAALRMFFYLPFEHSEALADQRRSLALFEALPDGDAGGWARLHLTLIERFGRFPHRNAALGRASTPDELAYLDAGGFAG